MLKNVLFLLLVSLEPVWVHCLIFAQSEAFSLSSLLIWLQYFLFFAFIFTFSRLVAAAVVIFESVVILLLLTYHHYFADPLTLMTVFSQAKEGLIFAARSPSSLIYPAAAGFMGFLLLKLLYIRCWYAPFRHTAAIRLTALFPFFCIALMSYSFFHSCKFEKRDFNRMAAEFGYVQAWGYELVTKMDRENLIENIVKDSVSAPGPLPEELKNVIIPDNVYVVQLESIDYAALIGKVNGKALMPFASGLAQKGWLYVIQAHDKEASANADFSVLTGTELYISMYSMIYGLMPPTHYDKMFTLPKLFKSQGYMTRFYHGFLGSFFNRREHIKAMGFDQVWFSENLPLTVPEGAWGFDDADLFEFVGRDNRQNPAPKNFNFIISVSSHEDFQIGTKHRKIINPPSSMKERFYNAAHYVDSALEKLVASAPENSLFVFYSDHLSQMSEERRTFMLIYQKGITHNRYQREVHVSKVSRLMKSLFSQIAKPSNKSE